MNRFSQPFNAEIVKKSVGLEWLIFYVIRSRCKDFQHYVILWHSIKHGLDHGLDDGLDPKLDPKLDSNLDSNLDSKFDLKIY